MIDELLKKWEQQVVDADAKLADLESRYMAATSDAEKNSIARDTSKVLTDVGYAHGYLDGAKFVKTLMEEKT